MLAVVIVLAVLGVGAYGVYSMMSEREPADVAKNEILLPPNEAPELMEEGKLLEALDAAREAMVLNPTAENRAIQTEVREAVQAEVEGYLTADPWTPEDLERAIDIAIRAAVVDPCDFLSKLEHEVKREEYSYKMMLVRPEQGPGGGEARFRLNALSEAAMESGDDTVTVKVGEVFANRFKLIRVGRSEAIVEDTLRDRRLIYYLSGEFASVG
jgi:hypothetical protein